MERRTTYEQLVNTPYEERKRREILFLAAASDANRRAIATRDIEAAIPDTESLSQTVFWRLHTRHIGENPLRAINASHPDDSINQNAFVYDLRRDGSDVAGTVRRVNVTVGPFRAIHPHYLPELEAHLFTLIDATITDPAYPTWDDTTLNRFLARVEAIQTLCHFPYDASGRTIEDFMVYLAHKAGRNVSFSQTGARGFVAATLIDQSSRLRQLVRQTTTHLIVNRFGEEKRLPPQLRTGFAVELAKQPSMNRTDIAILMAEYLELYGVLPYTDMVANVRIEIALDRHQYVLTQDLIANVHNPTAEVWDSYRDFEYDFSEVLSYARRVCYIPNFPRLASLPLVPLLLGKTKLECLKERGRRIEREDPAPYLLQARLLTDQVAKKLGDSGTAGAVLMLIREEIDTAESKLTGLKAALDTN